VLLELSLELLLLKLVLELLLLELLELLCEQS
jgi:hypothetical protein